MEAVLERQPASLETHIPGADSLREVHISEELPFWLARSVCRGINNVYSTQIFNDFKPTFYDKVV